ncbi:MAG: double-strand break repair helicase AddA [Pseudomonadota bacterium]
MTEPHRDAATERQVEAADPTASTWVSANAGSGKTRVLTDRVARLLLRGTPPQNVLCLTYTKAAASEMQNRLFKRLGAWSMAEDAELRTELATLGVWGTTDSATLASARRLFARAIETPGGLKIQTIHSFCAGVLRRFPLEAGLSPGFREMDDTATERLQIDVLRDLVGHDRETVFDMAALVSDPDFAPLCSAIRQNHAGFAQAPDLAATRARFGLSATDTAKTLIEDASSGVSADALRQIAAVLAEQSPTMRTLGALLTAAADEGAAAHFDALCKASLYAGRSDPKPSALTKGARTALGPLTDDFDTLATALGTAVDRLRALDAAGKTHIAHRFAAIFLPAYTAAKAERGLLDFDDLIDRTAELLEDRSVADWVLYRLDGGIDHVLVDEAQDTSPAQWRVIQLLTQEFTAGEGSAEPGARTIFVVGDMKQSIYSFQGAEPESFLRMKARFAERLERIGIRLNALELEYSFRSAPEILRVVDETFPPENRAGLGGDILHRAFRSDLPGRVDLWPVIAPPEQDDSGAWFDPVDRISPELHRAQLAAQVARAARAMVDKGQLADAAGALRPITAGDILVLVQSRGTLFHEVIRACKEVGLDVAGADVLKLTEELAVKDICAMLAFLDLPEDSLALATVLRSPLCGWSESALYDLAQGREETHLWAALRARKAEFPETHDMLADLRDASDYLRPYELIERILVGHDGRRKLVARLGPEATDGIDALLTRALAYERSEIPSLTGFLALQEASSAQIKRRAEGRGAKLRVMTVHGAKGLEAPIVILPDTAKQTQQDRLSDAFLTDDDGAALWSIRKDASPNHLSRLRQDTIDRRKDEARRLLYVAMTRAEQWLIVAAAGDIGRAPSESWYGQVAEGLSAAGAETLEDGALRLQSPVWPEDTAPRTIAAQPPDKAPALPDWTFGPVTPPARPATSRAPSDLGGAKVLPDEGDGPDGDALARGTRIHLLLEHLPDVEHAHWSAFADALLAPETCPPEDLDEVRTLLGTPELAPLFARDSQAEIGITAALPALGGARVHGQLDRLIVSPGHVLAVDFKTNRAVPNRPDDVPEGLLRQMGAYASALSQVFPDHQIETALLWTRSATLMRLPSQLVDAALHRANAAPDHPRPEPHTRP